MAVTQLFTTWVSFVRGREGEGRSLALRFVHFQDNVELVTVSDLTEQWSWPCPVLASVPRVRDSSSLVLASEQLIPPRPPDRAGFAFPFTNHCVCNFSHLKGKVTRAMDQTLANINIASEGNFRKHCTALKCALSRLSV